MKTLKIKAMALVAITLALGAFPAKDASAGPSQTYYLNNSNTYSDGVNYGSVTITIADSGLSAGFVVDATTAYYLSQGWTLGTQFGIDMFGFNVLNDPTQYSVVDLPSGWSVESNKNLDGFGTFEFRTTGDSVDPLAFTVNYTGAGSLTLAHFEQSTSGGNSPTGGNFFAAHIKGFIDGNGKGLSHFVAGSTTDPDFAEAIPEPSTLALAIGCIAPLAAVRLIRRRR